jgi:hypothetical protein
MQRRNKHGTKKISQEKTFRSKEAPCQENPAKQN